MSRISEKQRAHLEYMRSLRPADWRNKNGRPPKEAEVRKYQEDHPASTPWECAKKLDIKYATAKKWWNFQDTEKTTNKMMIANTDAEEDAADEIRSTYLE